MCEPRTEHELPEGSLQDEGEINNQLEQLDDVMFPAIDGIEPALRVAESAWRSTLQSLGPEKVQETRHQYLRYAQRTWNFLCQQSIQRPERILALAKIILMLTGDDGSLDG